MKIEDPVVIVSFARTPMGSFQGTFKDTPATALGARSIEAAIRRAGIDTAAINEVFMGNVLSAGLGQAPARQASLAAGIPNTVGSTTINKMCGSGMKAVMLAHDLIMADGERIIVAGGMESMTNAPYLLAKARAGLRIGHGKIYDHMYLDGLEDAYDKGRLMGTFAEDCADAYAFGREKQDEYAASSVRRAQKALENGAFADEIVPVTVSDKSGEHAVATDEQPLRVRIEKIPELKPAFRPGGTVTAANSSCISDGAAALVLMRLSRAETLGLSPVARILSHASYAGAPSLFTTAPVYAIRSLLGKLGLAAADIDLFEINEAFAVVALAAMHDLGLPWDKVNIHGGACALGHPIGASGARILVTLLAAMDKYRLKLGVASLCIGGGEATGLAVEMLH
ncbi:MAG: acetyl-CoA C-acyltransferase [Pseudomonadota bacterium]